MTLYSLILFVMPQPCSPCSRVDLYESAPAERLASR
jgi:hypothetical protein